MKIAREEGMNVQEELYWLQAMIKDQGSFHLVDSGFIF